MIQAFHVSGSQGLTRIDPHRCDDLKRDGLLYGAPVACFSTTTGFPKTSVYPRSFDVGAIAYRYTHDFDPDDYDKFKMADTWNDKRTSRRQVHFLLLRKDDAREREVAWFIRTYASEAVDTEMWSACFPGGQPNNFYSDSTPGIGRFTFVNVMFWHSVPVQFERNVAKSGQSPFGCGRVTRSKYPLWLKKLEEHIQERTQRKIARAVRRWRALESAKQKVETLETTVHTATVAPAAESTAPVVEPSLAAPTPPTTDSSGDATDARSPGLELEENAADPGVPDLEDAFSSLRLAAAPSEARASTSRPE